MPRVVVKVRVVRNRGSAKILADHLRYLAREGEPDTGERPRFFDADGFLDDPDRHSFLQEGGEARHHFRLILSPDQAEGLQLPTFTRAVVSQMEQDLGTRLKWLGTSHFDTEHPHAHVVIHGRDEKGHDLVLRRDYIANGLRQRARAVAGTLVEPRLLRAPGRDRNLDILENDHPFSNSTRSLGPPLIGLRQR